MLLVTLREDPAEAEIISHKLLLRAGYIRRVSPGIYVYLPLLWRVLGKIMHIVRTVMDEAGAQECLLPQLQPASLWQESGRWDTYTQGEGIMFALKDRQERELGLGPTHEEVITDVARNLLRSYRQLPINLYQIQTKFRDEIRPRFGLMRGREFIMKDAYSFDMSEADMKASYDGMYRAYCQIFERCGLDYRPVQADSGAIGGAGSQEFMILAQAGEDEVLYTPDGTYAANVEKAVSLPPDTVPSSFTKAEQKLTQNTPTIAALCDGLNCSPTQVVKNLLYQAILDTGLMILVLVSIRGDQEVNEVKLSNEISRLASDFGAQQVLKLTIANQENQKQWASRDLTWGYIAPNLPEDYLKSDPQIHPKFVHLCDETVVKLANFITGANEIDHHWVGANWGQEFPAIKTSVDVRKARPGDRALHDSQQILHSARGIEVGHIFQLGTKYSQKMGATFTNEQGQELPLVMGCYGLGVSRLAQAAIEQSHDEYGIIWPPTIAPYLAIISVPNMQDAQQVKVAESLYQELQKAGIEVLLDDRPERAGVKFKDADLLGIPYRIVPGRSLAQNKVEIVTRNGRVSQEVLVSEVADFFRTLNP